jgi:hypothetical protein
MFITDICSCFETHELIKSTYNAHYSTILPYTPRSSASSSRPDVALIYHVMHDMGQAHPVILNSIIKIHISTFFHLQMFS